MEDNIIDLLSPHPGDDPDTAVAPVSLAAIVRYSQDAIISKDLDGTIKSWNSAAEKIFGYNILQMVGQPIFRMVPDDKFEEERNLLSLLSKGEQISHFETQRITREGKILDVELKLSPIFDPAGSIVGASTIARDITARKKSERALLHTQEKLNMAVSLTGLGIWEYRISDQAVTISQEIQAIYEIPEGLAVDYDFLLSCLVGQDRQKIQDVMQRVATARTGERFQEDIQIRCYGQTSTKWVRIQGKYMPQTADQPESILGTIIDVTSEKTENERLEKFAAERTAQLHAVNQKLADSNADLERFAFTASHDLREPLRKIVSYADLLREALTDNPARAIDIINRMRSSSVRMMAMIDDLLQFSRVTQQAEEAFTKLDLRSVILEVTEDLETLITSKRANVVWEGDFPDVRGSHSLIKQVLQNLIQNAIKFSKPTITPQVIIYGQALRPDLSQKTAPLSSGYLQVTVSDNGIGFDSRHAERIFGLFERLNGRSEYEGSGMGLAICKKIIQAHKGYIHAHGQPGNGATFTIGLPLF